MSGPDVKIKIAARKTKKSPSLKRVRVFEPGDILFRPGDRGESAYLIFSGQVEILKNYPDKPERIALFEEGRIFGEMSLVNEKPRSMTARAVTETRLEVVNRDGFEEMILRRPAESLKYLKALFERLRLLMSRIEGDAGSRPEADEGKAWKMRLIPLTDMAKVSVPEEGLTLTVFPFRLGRASQHGQNLLQSNDLALADVQPHFVSRNHLSLDIDNGQPIVRDRGSYLGTIVNGVKIGGGHRGAVCPLREGENELVVGSEDSPFRFRILVSDR